MPTFPVDLRTWLGCLHMEQQVFDLTEGLTVQNRTAGGQVLRSGGAERLWKGSLSMLAHRYEDGRALHAKLHMLRGTGASFLISDLTYGGASFGASLSGVQANGTVNIGGIPAARTIAAGDYLGFAYNGIRALHQFVTGGAASGLEVVPPIRPGWTAGTAVTIGAPTCAAVMVPGTLRVGMSNRVATLGASFDWVQLLRSAA